MIDENQSLTYGMIRNALRVSLVARSATLGFRPAADADEEEAWSGDEEVPLRIDPNSVWGGLSLGGQRADCLSLARVRARGVLG